MAVDGIPFGFDTYGTNKGGLVVGRRYQDENTGYWYTFCQAHTVLSGDTFAVGQHAVQVSATAKGVCSNQGTGALDATYIPALGIVTSACPESTSTVTYYFWALSVGYTDTILNDGTDVTVGYLLYPIAADPVTSKAIVGSATSSDWIIRSTYGRAAETTAGTTTKGFVNFTDI